jgi:signal peptidase I
MTLRKPELTRGQRLAVESVILVVAAVFLAVLLRGFVAEAFRIPSASMEPQLDIGDRVIVSRTAYKLHDPRRGDVIVFDCPVAAGCARPGKTNIVVRGIRVVEEAVLLREPQPEEYIKRVIGLPGDTVEGKNGIVYVNDQPLEEPYLPVGTRTSDFAPTVVAPGHLWVMGDNRGNSSDSRVFGQIDQDTIVGRAILRVWPPWRTAFL